MLAPRPTTEHRRPNPADDEEPHAQRITPNLWFDTEAMLGMRKLDIEELRRAADGVPAS